MSTPVSVDPPPMAHLRTGSQQEREFQQKIEQMIALQYHEQNLAAGKLKNSSGIEPLSLNTSNTSQQQRQPPRIPTQPTRDSTTSTTSKSNNETTKTPWSSQRFPTPLSPSQSGVGTGTLLFPEGYQSGTANQNALPRYGAIPQDEQLFPEQYQQVEHQQHDFHYGNSYF